jgi:predicted lipid-binding transport protein (Tim44 family)
MQHQTTTPHTTQTKQVQPPPTTPAEHAAAAPDQQHGLFNAALVGHVELVEGLGLGLGVASLVRRGNATRAVVVFHTVHMFCM